MKYVVLCKKRIFTDNKCTKQLLKECSLPWHFQYLQLQSTQQNFNLLERFQISLRNKKILQDMRVLCPDRSHRNFISRYKIKSAQLNGCCFSAPTRRILIQVSRMTLYCFQLLAARLLLNEVLLQKIDRFLFLYIIPVTTYPHTHNIKAME